MSVAAREEIIYKYSIDDTRGLSFSELFGLIFMDLADSIEYNDIDELDEHKMSPITSTYHNRWMNHVIYMYRNGYRQYCMPDAKSIVLDGTYISIKISPCGYDGIEITYNDKDTRTCRTSHMDVEECFNILDLTFAVAVDSKNTTD